MSLWLYVAKYENESSVFKMTVLRNQSNLVSKRRDRYSAHDLGHSPQDLMSQSGNKDFKKDEGSSCEYRDSKSRQAAASALTGENPVGVR